MSEQQQSCSGEESALRGGESVPFVPSFCSGDKLSGGVAGRETAAFLPWETRGLVLSLLGCSQLKRGDPQILADP